MYLILVLTLLTLSLEVDKHPLRKLVDQLYVFRYTGFKIKVKSIC
jgi:hypothetical protein